MLALLFAVLLAAVLPQAATADQTFWSELKSGGAAVLIRHTRAPGTGDPAGFKAGDCATQRNLDASGRAHARRIGAAFREQGIAVTRVLASRWCRAQDTAREMGVGTVGIEPALDSLYHQPNRGDAQVADLKALIGGLGPRDLVVMGTHSFTVRALTGVLPAEGEMVAVRAAPDGGIKVVGRLLVP